MKRIRKAWVCIVITILSATIGVSQNLNGITGNRDTSYTNAIAFAKDVKKYPQIKLVEEFTLENVQEEKDIIYCSDGERNLKLDVFQNITQIDSVRTAIIIIHGGGWRISGSGT